MTSDALCPALAAAASSSWSRPQLAGLLVEPGDHRLERGHAFPAGGQRRADARRHDGLADLGVRPGDEDAAQLGGVAEPVEHLRGSAADRCGLAVTHVASTCAASRSSERVCDAITASRRRELPAGTVGGRIAWAKMPFSSARSLARTASSASPTITGTICVGCAGHRQALRGQRLAQHRGVPLELLDPARLLAQQVERRHRGRHGGWREGRREDQRASGVDQVLRDLARRSTRMRRRSRAPCRAFRRSRRPRPRARPQRRRRGRPGPIAPVPWASSTITRAS